jgi:hypothetical protein
MNLEIHTYFIHESRQTLEVEFTIFDEELETTHNLEILLEEIEHMCDLYEDLSWYDFDNEEQGNQVIDRKINTHALVEGLQTYVTQNIQLLNS